MHWYWFHIILFFIGFVLTYLSYTQYKKTKTLLQEGVKTTASVSGFDTHNGKNSVMYTPIFEYTDKLQNTQSFKSKVSTSRPSYDVGERVSIVYNPKKPSDVSTISFWGLYGKAVVLLMTASPLLVLGTSYFLYTQP